MLETIDTRLEGAIGGENLRRLHGSTVGVVGTGLLGGQLVPHLAQLQIRTLLVDPGTIEPPNLGNQMLPADALGESKARVRARQMRELNPSCPVRVLNSPIEDVGLGVFADCDLLLSGLDSRASRLVLNGIARLLGLDWIDAAVDGSGSRLYGSVSWFRPHREDSPCYGCHFDGARLAEIAAEGRGAGCASWRAPAHRDTPPTLTASPLGAIVAGHQMSWGIQALLGSDAGLAGRQLQISGAGQPRMRTVELSRGRCVFPHQRLQPLERVGDLSVGGLLARAREQLGAAPDALIFPGRSLVHDLVCPACGARRELVKRREAVRDDEVVCGCGSSHEMAPVAFSDRISAAEASRLQDLAFSALGLPSEDLVRATTADGRTGHYLLTPAEKE